MVADFPLVPVEQRASNLAADRYLASLTSETSKRSMRSALETIARQLVRIPRLGRKSHVVLSAVPWARIDVDVALAVRSWLAATYKPATANRLLAATRGVLGAGDLLTEPLRKATQRIRGESAPSARGLTLGDLQRLLEACMADTRTDHPRRSFSGRTTRPRGFRDACAIALLFCGLRRAEVVGLDLDGWLSGQRMLRVSGKGRKERLVPVHEGAAQVIDRWLDVRGRAEGPLLCRMTKAGAPTLDRLSTQAVWDLCRDAAEKAGIEPFAPHDARRYAAGAVLDVAELSTAGAYLGHSLSSAATTMRYDTRGLRRVQVAVERTQWPAVDLSG